MRRFLVIIAAVTLSGLTAKAQDTYNPLRTMSAEHILEACKQNPEKPDPRQSQLSIGLCLGQIQMLYMLAYIDALAPDRKFCPPPRGVSILDFRDVIVRYIEDRPNLNKLPFVFVAIYALKNEWPCR
jgi:hypothetical protein